MRRKTPDYFEELFDQKFFIVVDNIDKMNFAKTFFSGNSKLLIKQYSSSAFNDTKLFKSKAMILLPKNILPQKDQLKHFIFKHYEDPIKFSRNNIMSAHSGLAFCKNNILYGTFRELLQRLRDSGITKKHIKSLTEIISDSKEARFSYVRLYDEKADIRPLSWEQLYAGFYIWLFASAISTFAFIAEKLIFFIRN